MIERRSSLKGFKVGDLVYYKIRAEISRSSISTAGAQVVDKKRTGLIVELERDTAMGFQMVRVLWNDMTEIDTIAENYLHLIK